MNKLLGEFEKQKYMVFLLPYRNDIWRRDAKPIQDSIVALANVVAKYEPVILGVLPRLKDYLLSNFKLDKNITVLEMVYNDAWPRDSISDVVFDEQNKPFIYSYGFNSYGDHLYYPWDDDEKLDQQLADFLNYPIKKSPITTEGGNMIGDGNGTLFVVEDALVNPNRNPGMSKEEIENSLKESTGCQQIIWVPRGLDFDETGGHIDNILAFVDKNTLLLSWTDDKENEHYDRVREIEKYIKAAKNIEGKKYNIIHLPVPRITYRDEEDCKDIVALDGSFPREVGDEVLNTYVNIIIANNLVVLPKFGIPEDEEAYRIVKEAFKGREVVQLDGKEANLGGGGFHCLSKHIN